MGEAIVKNAKARGLGFEEVSHFKSITGKGIEAYVGIAIGSGTDVAIETADVVLMKGELTEVALKLSKATIKNIKQNLFWAFFYNTAGIPLAMGLFFALNYSLTKNANNVFLLRPAITGAAMAFSSVSVVSNALRLKRFKVKA